MIYQMQARFDWRSETTVWKKKDGTKERNDGEKTEKGEDRLNVRYKQALWEGGLHGIRKRRKKKCGERM